MKIQKLLSELKQNDFVFDKNNKEILFNEIKKSMDETYKKQLHSWVLYRDMLKILIKKNANFATIIDFTGVTFLPDSARNIVYTTSIVVNRNYLYNVITRLDEIRRYLPFWGNEKILLIKVQRNRNIVKEGDYKIGEYFILKVLPYKLFFNKTTFKDLVEVRNKGWKIILIVEGVGLPLLKIIFKNFGIVISSGKNSFKGTLSPTQYNLSRIMFVLFNTSAYKVVTQSFYNENFINKPYLDLTESNLDFFIKTIILGDTRVFNFIYSSFLKYNKLVKEENRLTLKKFISDFNKHISCNPTKLKVGNNKKENNLDNLGISRRGIHTSTKITLSQYNTKNYFRSNQKRFYSSMIEMNQYLYQDNTFLGKLGPKVKIYFNHLELFNIELFTRRILQSINIETNYLLLIKVRYKNYQFLTLGHQSRFYIDDYKSTTIFKDLNEFVKQKVELLSVEYNFMWTDVQEIELSFREVLFLSNKPNKISSVYKDFINNKTFIEISKHTSFFDQTIKEVVRDVEVKTENGNITDMKFDLIDEPIDFIKNVENQNKFLKPDNRINLNENLENSTFGQKAISDKVIIIKSEKLSDTQVKKIAFTKEGRLLASVTDTMLPDGTLKRTWKGNTIILKGDKIIFRSKSYEFSPIKLELFSKNKKITALPDVKIGTFDMEVFIQGNSSKVYALGFYSYLDDKPQMFYINKELDSNRNVFNCLNEMFKPKYKDITWYCHNSGKYDARILLNVLYSYNDIIKKRNNTIMEYNSDINKYNELVLEYNNLIRSIIINNNQNFEKFFDLTYNNDIIDYNKKVYKLNKKYFVSNTYIEYKLKILEKIKKIEILPTFDIKTRFRKTTILNLQISKIVDNTKYTISINDSYAIFTDSLKILANKYNVTTQKGDFPHTFANEKTIFYIGSTPDIFYYGNISRDEYNLLYSDSWNFKNESLKYLSKDLVSLYEVLNTSNKSLHLNFNVQMVNCLTVSRLASDIYLKNFVDNNTSRLPYVNNMTIFDDIRQAYFGGITEVYRPIGYKLFYYDVNSLYPYASYNAMPGLKSEFVDYFDNTIPLDDSLFGFFYCKIKTYDSGYLGLLPYRTKDRVIYPLGSWEGWYFSEELKFARDNGYSIEVIKGYKFNKAYDTFKTYVDTLSEMKANSEDITLKNLSKLLLNSLIGKYGMHPIQPITKVVDKNKVGNILITRKLAQEIDITNNDVLLSYLPGPDKDILDEFEVNFHSALKIEKYSGVDKHTYIKNISIPVSAAVTAYARIYMSKAKLDILNNNGKIYYSDTDSIITNLELDKNLVHPKKIGKFKLEYVIDEAIIPAPKVYCIKIVDNKSSESLLIRKVKGGSSNNLTMENYKSMLEGVPMKISKTTSKTDWFEGTVSIEKDTITLSSDNYISREKIYDNHNNWIDTLPVNINDLNTRIKLGIEKKTLNKENTVKINKIEDYRPILENNNNKKYRFIFLLTNISYIALIIVSFAFYFSLYDIEDGDIEDRDIDQTLQNSNSDYQDHNSDYKGNNINIKIEKTNDQNIEYVTPTNDNYDPFLKENEISNGNDNIYKDIPLIANKTLYEGFLDKINETFYKENSSNIKEDIFNIKEDKSNVKENNKSNIKELSDTDSCSSDTDYDDSSTFSSAVNTRPSTTYSIKSYQDNSNSQDYNLFSNFINLFSITTVNELEKEIDNNLENINKLDELCKDPYIKPHILENLLDERKHLLEQKLNHLESTLNKSKVETDEYSQETLKLKQDLDNLSKTSEELNNLKNIKDNNSSDVD